MMDQLELPWEWAEDPSGDAETGPVSYGIWIRTDVAHQYLLDHRKRVVSIEDLANHVGWELSTARTYAQKKWRGILIRRSRDVYYVTDFHLTRRQFRELHTQVDDLVPRARHLPIRCLERVGGGAYGTVWKALDEDLGRMVAVKVIHSDAEDSFGAKKHAVAIAKAEGHPNVVYVHYVGLVQTPDEPNIDRLAVVMPLILGETFEDRLGRSFEVKEARDLGLCLCDALSHIHRKGVVHGDFHERNIIMSEYGPVVIDLMNRHGYTALSTSAPALAEKGDVGSLARVLGMMLETVVPIDTLPLLKLLDRADTIDWVRSSFLELLGTAET